MTPLIRVGVVSSVLSFVIGYACAYQPTTTEYVEVPVVAEMPLPPPALPDLGDGVPDVELEGAPDDVSVEEDLAEECAEDPGSC